MGIVLARPAVLDELFHAAQGAHGVARGPEGCARVPRRTALAVEHVGDGVHRFESGVGLHRTVADAQHEHRRPREALADIGDHLLDLSGVVGVVLHARLHDVQPVLEHHQIVAQHGVDLGVDRRVGPEHRLPVVAAHGVVVDHDAPVFENRSVADEVLRAGEHLEGERADTGGRDGDLPHGVIARDVEFAALGVVERHLDAAVAGREEEDARRGARIEAFAVVGALPAGRSPGRRLAHPARDVEILAQARGCGFALHDVVGRPALRLGFDRAPERRQRRGHRGESRAAARVGRLEPFAQVGREDVAQDLISKTTALPSGYSEYDETFGSDVRDQSIQLMTLCLLDKGKEAATLVEELSKQLSSDDWLSTQSTAFALVALSDYLAKYRVDGAMDFTYACGGKDGQVKTDKNIWSETLLDKAGTSASVELKNTGKSTLFARIITEGIPEQGEEKAYANGVSLAVSYVDLNGRPVNVAQLEQGTNFSAVVTVKNPSARGYNNLVLSEIFPAGWEILNTRFLNESATDSLSAGVNYQDIRDDRVYSYIDRLPAGSQVTVKINLCAVYPGRFYLPPVYCEAMYDYLIRANTAGQEVTVF